MSVAAKAREDKERDEQVQVPRWLRGRLSKNLDETVRLQFERRVNTRKERLQLAGAAHLVGPSDRTCH